MALSGVAGVAMLVAHFQIPAHVPGDNMHPLTSAPKGEATYRSYAMVLYLAGVRLWIRRRP